MPPLFEKDVFLIPAASKSHQFPKLISILKCSARRDSDCLCTLTLEGEKTTKKHKLSDRNASEKCSEVKSHAGTLKTAHFYSLSPTWSSLLVCRRRCLKKSRREHFLTRMRSVVPSARWAEGDRPLGLRGHAQLMLAALMAMNFPRITLQPPLPSETATHTLFYLAVRVYRS